MKILFLGEAKKKHVRDWAAWLLDQGAEVEILSDQLPASLEHRGKQLRVTQPQWSFWQNLWTYKLRGGPLANNRDKWRVYLPLIQSIKPDIVHAHEALGYGPILPHVPKGIPRVLTPWGPDIEAALNNPISEKARLVQKACHAAQAIVTNAGGLEEHWSTRLKISKERLYFFPWGTNLSVFKPVTREERLKLRDKWILPEEAMLFFCPRIPRPLYRHDEILKAWKKFRLGTNSQPAHLLFLTGGDAAPEEWTRPGIPDFSFIERECSEKEMAELYQLSNFTLMIPETDLLAQSLLEATACGSVPVLNRLPAYADFFGQEEARSKAHCLWVENGVFKITEESMLAIGVLVESLKETFQQALELLPETRERLGKENAAFAAAYFDETVCRKQLLDVYDLLLNKAKTP